MRSARRLLVAVLCLAAFDQTVPPLLRRLERRRYEETRAFRFESSDLFALGPLTSYLREHPRGERPRILFLGNSVMFGYELMADEAVPARFQERHPDTQVFNAAINGFDLGSNYLVTAALLDAVDRVYVMRGSAAVNPLLTSLIPIDADDRTAFHLDAPDPIESRLQSIAGHWQLYASTYRLQAALFGTSAREYVYRRIRPAATRTFSAGDGRIDVSHSHAAEPPSAARRAELRAQDDLLWTFAQRAYDHRTRVVFLEFGSHQAGGIGPPEAADFNAAFAPYAELVTLTVPAGLLYDGRHLTPSGAQRLAEALP